MEKDYQKDYDLLLDILAEVRKLVPEHRYYEYIDNCLGIYGRFRGIDAILGINVSILDISLEEELLVDEDLYQKIMYIIGIKYNQRGSFDYFINALNNAYNMYGSALPDDQKTLFHSLVGERRYKAAVSILLKYATDYNTRLNPLRDAAITVGFIESDEDKWQREKRELGDKVAKFVLEDDMSRYREYLREGEPYLAITELLGAMANQGVVLDKELYAEFEQFAHEQLHSLAFADEYGHDELENEILLAQLARVKSKE